MTTFPFTAVVGQEALKTALLLAIVDPRIGGVLVSGSRGSAKSTLVRGLSRLADERPLVTLPLGATEEMVTGTLKLERALASGEVDYAPGLLARAHGGLLYVDEVNLLPDHLVDLLLDVAASGVNHVERDGISHRHDARFVLVGTMNPDEGELRPQLLDRFGLMATVQERFSVAERREIVQRRIAHDTDPAAFAASQRGALDALGERIRHAARTLDAVAVPEDIANGIAERCARAGVDGLRADITLYRAARAHAALAGRPAVSVDDLDAVEELVLRHRRAPLDEAPPSPGSAGSAGTGGSEAPGAGGSSIQGSWGRAPSLAAPIEEAGAPPPDGPDPFVDTAPARAGFERVAAQDPGRQRGARRIVRDGSGGSGARPDWFRILADPQNRERRRHGQEPARVYYRHPVRRAATLNLLLLDTSASTLGHRGLGRAKGVVRSLARRSYLARERFSLVTFGNERVDTVITPQRAPFDIGPRLAAIRGGGGTPFHKAMHYVDALVGRLRASVDHCNVYILTDGRVRGDACGRMANLEAARTTIVDVESGYVRLGLGRHIARRLGARYLHVDALPGNGPAGAPH